MSAARRGAKGPSPGDTGSDTSGPSSGARPARPPSRATATATAFALALSVIALDQGTKALVRATIERGERDPVFFGIDLVNTRNTGVAFGFLGDQGGGTLVLLFTIAALVALLVWFARHRGTALAWLPTGLLLGGALGNRIDRTWDEGVTDFIDLPWWPAFNVADIAITFGVLTLLYVLEGPPRKERERAGETAPAARGG